MGARRSTTQVVSIFWGYSASLIAQWCGVSVHTAYLYKIGKRKPSRQALRLFTLHRDGQFLTADWAGWAVTKDHITDPDGNRTTRGQLQAYWIIVQLAHQLAADAGVLDQYYTLLRRA
jgi:hypothetical protein